MTFTRTHYAMAASLAALAVAAPAVFYSMHGGLDAHFGNVQSPLAGNFTRTNSPVEIAKLEERNRPSDADSGAKSNNEKKTEAPAPVGIAEPAKPRPEPEAQAVASQPAEPAPAPAHVRARSCRRSPGPVNRAGHRARKLT